MNRSPVLAGLLAATALLPAAAWAGPAYRLATVVCVPGDTTTMNSENKLVAEGVIRRSGRTTPPHLYFCPVFNPDFTTDMPSLARLQFTYADNTGAPANVKVSLYKKNLLAPVGTTTLVSQAVSVAGGGVQTAAAAVPEALNFSVYVYWIVIQIAGGGGSGAVVDVHEVALTH